MEIEIGVLRGQCLNRHIGERETLLANLDAWKRQRNSSGARIKWMFTTALACDQPAQPVPAQPTSRNRGAEVP